MDLHDDVYGYLRLSYWLSITKVDFVGVIL
jgi:hypothetical protein